MTFHISIDVIGQQAIDAALSQATEAVAAASTRASERSIGPVAQAIANRTPVRTGFLRASEDVFVETPFMVTLIDLAPYALFVERRNPFVERGTEDASAEIEAIYADEIEQMAATFGQGI